MPNLRPNRFPYHTKYSLNRNLKPLTKQGVTQLGKCTSKGVKKDTRNKSSNKETQHGVVGEGI